MLFFWEPEVIKYHSPLLYPANDSDHAIIFTKDFDWWCLCLPLRWSVQMEVVCKLMLGRICLESKKCKSHSHPHHLTVFVPDCSTCHWVIGRLGGANYCDPFFFSFLVSLPVVLVSSNLSSIPLYLLQNTLFTWEFHAIINVRYKWDKNLNSQ